MVALKLDLVEQLKAFPFGRFLLQNRGINGYWTYYMLTHPRAQRKDGMRLTELEQFILDKAPTMLATQQRFEIFLGENQKSVREGANLACIPCGMMGELLYLDFKGIDNIQLLLL